MSAKAEHGEEEPREAHKKSQTTDARKQSLASNGKSRLMRSTKRLEGTNSEVNMFSADMRIMAIPSKSEKPAFSALQHEFGAKEAPKEPHSQSHLHDIPDDGVIKWSSPEVIASNIELLQLHMLHRSSSATKAQWESSGEKHYRSRFQGLASDHKNMTIRESSFQEQVNASAIIAWGNGKDGLTIGSKIRKLSYILTEVVDASNPDGQYTCLLQSFEHWYSNASMIRQLRERTGSVYSHVEKSLEGIGDGWKAEADILKSKLLSSQTELVLLGEAYPQSDLTRCLDALLGMVTNMLEEIEAVQAIESQMLHDEEDWLKDALRRIAADLSSSISVPVNTEWHR